jgi:hypothetical protein
MNLQSELYSVVKDEEKLEEETNLEETNLKVKSELFKRLQESLNKSSIEKFKAESIDNNETLEASLKSLQGFNKVLLVFLKKVIDSLKDLNVKDIKLEKEEIEDEKKADKILSGLMVMLPEKVKQEIDIEKYINTGLDGLRKIENLLKDVSTMDIEEAKLLAIFYSEINSLISILREQNSIIENLAGRQLFRKINRQDEIARLKILMAKEISEYNQVVKSIGDFRITSEISEIEEIAIFEHKEIAISKELILLLRQYNIPKMDFPSGNFCTYQCPLQEFLLIIKNQTFSLLPCFKQPTVCNGKSFALSYLPLNLNKIVSSQDIVFIFPEESVIKDTVFTMDSKLIMVYDSHVDTSQFEVSQKMVENLMQEIDSKMAFYISESKKLDQKFSSLWSEDAMAIITKEFTSRWISESSETYSMKNNFNIVPILISMKMLELVQVNKQTDSKSVLEEIEKMGKDDFKKLIEKTKVFLSDSLNDLKKVSGLKGLEINDSIALIPKKYVPYCEKYFDAYGTRPNVFYYDGNVNDSITKAMKECKKNRNTVPLPKTRYIRLFRKEDYFPLEIM